MAMRSKEFVGKAEGIKSHELSVKSLIESIKDNLSNLTAKKRYLKRELSSLYAELVSAENDYDDGPDYGLIASIERQINQTNDEIETTEIDISKTTGELEKAEQEYEKVEEEKQQTLFEIQQRARTYSQDIAKIGGAYGAYATIGQSISQSMQANYDALSKAATILDSSIDSIGSRRSSSGGGVSGRNGPSLAGSNGAAAIAGASNIRSSDSSTSSMRSSQGSVGNNSNGSLRASNGGNIGIKPPSYTSSQISRQGAISFKNAGKSIISSNNGIFGFQSNQDAYDSGIIGNPYSFGSNEILENGTIIFTGNGIVVKGNHSGMPRRTDAYLPGDERGHIQASSLAGDNTPQNVVPQASDLNHGAYNRMERTERKLIKQGNNVLSQKIAYSSNQPGNRPDAFMVNDTIMHSDGTTEVVHLSFANLMNNEQESLNSYLEKQMDIVNVQNPADVLRETLTSKDYAVLMEAIAGEMLNIDDEYTGTCLMITQELSGGVLENGRMAPTAASATNKREEKTSFKESLIVKSNQGSDSIFGIKTPGGILTNKYLGAIYSRINVAEKKSRALFNYALKNQMVAIFSASSKEAYYDMENRGIYFDAVEDENDEYGEGKGTTLFHESGHAIDHALGGDAFLSNNEEFLDCLNRDCANIVHKMKNDPEWSSRFKELIMISPDAYSISDIMEGLTNGAISGACGHMTQDKNYWKNDKYAICNEAFAHFFEASMGGEGKRLKYIKISFPQAYEKYQKMIQPFVEKQREELERER